MENLREEDYEKRVAPKGTKNVCAICDFNGTGCWNSVNRWASSCGDNEDMAYYVKKQPDQSPAPITFETDIEYLREAVDKLMKHDDIIFNAFFHLTERLNVEIGMLEKKVKKLKHKIKAMSKPKSKKDRLDILL